MTELLLTLNIAAITAVLIHHLIAKKPKVGTPKPQIKFKKAKRELTEEEKRNAEILEEISKYNGMEVAK